MCETSAPQRNTHRVIRPARQCTENGGRGSSRSHRVRCGGGRHGRRRNGDAGPGPGDYGRGRGPGGRWRPARSARLHRHGVAGPAGTAQGARHHRR